jgi:hypothetical protein
MEAVQKREREKHDSRFKVSFKFYYYSLTTIRLTPVRLYFNNIFFFQPPPHVSSLLPSSNNTYTVQNSSLSPILFPDKTKIQ